MNRPTALVLLGALGLAVFLAGLELMITAVALPTLLLDLARGPDALTQLRRASWIINGYFIVTVVTMPLAGRLADAWGSRRLVLAGIVVFVIGSALSGRAQSIDELVASRLLQALGGGILIPVATSAASHLFAGAARPRALGVIGGLTFLGMAAGPFLGATILLTLHPATALASAGIEDGPLVDALSPAWRWVFYVNVPAGLVALVLVWASTTGWDTPRRPARVDLAGAVLFTVVLGAALAGVTLLGARETPIPGIGSTALSLGLLALAALAAVALVLAGLRRDDPFLDPRVFRTPALASAALVSLLTGYGFATAIAGGAVFVDRVLYGGPDRQAIALGGLAGATALGAIASGLLVKLVSLRAVALVGIVASVAALVVVSASGTGTAILPLAAALALFGLGFGLTVTPRSTAAVEAVGERAFGVASAAVTVARMIGMAIGFAVLTAYGSTTIERLYDQVYATPDSYKAFVPADLRDRELRDGLVVDALERWAASEAARVIGPIFVGAAAVTALAAIPALALGGAERRAEARAPTSGRGRDDEPEVTISL
ncbi:MAG TPA: MFS transporter [Candidatus Limnocylindrales bacterium]|nr:MFS transporter [Candidatus Limnocylindrales bacterium]